MSSLNVKKGDEVVILSGKDAGKKGKILAVLTDSQRVVVEGRQKVSKNKKPVNQQDVGGIVTQEASIHVSNVQLICPKCGKAVRTGNKFVEENGKKIKVRVCKKCGAEIKTADTAK